MSAAHSHTARRFIYGLVLLPWIGAYAWLLWDGRYQDFLRSEFNILIIGGMAILIVLLGAVLLSQRPGAHVHHAHGKTMWVHACVLLLPVIYLTDAQDHSLGGYAYKKRTISQGYRVAGSGPETDPRAGPAIDQGLPEATLPADAGREAAAGTPLSLADILKFPDRYAGQEVKTIGMLYQDPEFLPPGKVVVFRFMMVCCAADVRPIEVLVAPSSAPTLSNDTWVEVQGILAQQNIGGAEVPLLREATITKTTEPKTPFLDY